MKLGSGGSGTQDKKQTITAIVAIVVILVAVGLLAKNFMGGDGGGGAPIETPSSGPPGADAGAPPGGPDIGGMPGTTPPQAGSPGVEPVPGATPPAGAPAPSTAPAQPPPAASKAAPPAAKPAPKGATRQMKVFGTVTVSYPANWKISAGPANSYAMFTDGNAGFAVHAPDPTADSAKKIAELAMKQLTPDAVITAQGTDKVGGNNAHWFAVRYKGKTARVVGIDGPTRVAVVETVKSGDFGKYRAVFDRMQSEMSIGGR